MKLEIHPHVGVCTTTKAFTARPFAMPRSYRIQKCIASAVPSFLPQPYTAEVEEPAAQTLIKKMIRTPLQVPSLGTVQTNYVGPDAPSSNRPAFVLLHGFDSSLLEFRRFVPVLSQVADVYAVDLAGWGFTDCGFAENPNISLGPLQKREHLKVFIEQVIGRPVTLLGASLGGTVSIDFALNHPDLVERLVLVDAQALIDGIGPLASMPRFLSVLGVKVLKSVPLRQMANKMAYYNKDRYSTDDAMRIGRLHTHLEGWTEANVAFMQSGGYAVSTRLSEISCPSLIVWGRNDEILSPDNASQLQERLPNAKLVWLEECGHCGHLEQPQALLAAIQEFLGETAAGGVAANTAQLSN